MERGDFCILLSGSHKKLWLIMSVVSFMSGCIVDNVHEVQRTYVTSSYSIVKMSIKHGNVQMNNGYQNQPNQILSATTTRKPSSRQLGAFSIILKTSTASAGGVIGKGLDRQDGLDSEADEDDLHE